MFLGSTSCTKSAREAAGSGSEELKKNSIPLPLLPCESRIWEFFLLFLPFLCKFSFACFCCIFILLKQLTCED